MPLILPESVRPRVRVCEMCGKEFPWAHLSRLANHVQACENGSAEEHVRERQGSVFTSSADPEARQWVGKRLSEGKPATKRGRLL